MVGGMACYSPNCSQPVSGQCPGYKGSCGRFYCRTHSTGTLCGVCAARQADDEAEARREAEIQQMVEEYSAIAESLQPKVTATSVGRGSVALLFSLALLFGGPLMLAMFYVGIAYGSLQALAFGSLLALGLVLIYGVYRRAKTDAQREADQRKADLARFEATKPGFKEFYVQWQKHQDDEKRARNAALTMALLGTTVKAVGVGYKKLDENLTFGPKRK
ncbi:MAG: hypothetical protein U0641_13750 [Anaerolineae bacterium]